ncbi:hypothetical protein MRX96_024237 [Rhipicephalus microplus]
MVKRNMSSEIRTKMSHNVSTNTAAWIRASSEPKKTKATDRTPLKTTHVSGTRDSTVTRERMRGRCPVLAAASTKRDVPKEGRAEHAEGAHGDCHGHGCLAHLAPKS